MLPVHSKLLECFLWEVYTCNQLVQPNVLLLIWSLATRSMRSECHPYLPQHHNPFFNINICVSFNNNRSIDIQQWCCLLPPTYFPMWLLLLLPRWTCLRSPNNVGTSMIVPLFHLYHLYQLIHPSLFFERWQWCGCRLLLHKQTSWNIL